MTKQPLEANDGIPKQRTQSPSQQSSRTKCCRLTGTAGNPLIQHTKWPNFAMDEELKTQDNVLLCSTRIRALCTPVPEQHWQFGNSDSWDKLILPQIAWNYVRAGVYYWKPFPWKAKRCSQEAKPAQALNCRSGTFMFTSSKINSQIIDCSRK